MAIPRIIVPLIELSVTHTKYILRSPKYVTSSSSFGSTYHHNPVRIAQRVLHGAEAQKYNMPSKQATLGYVKSSQQTLGWALPEKKCLY